jgi:hypothetical protein
MGKAYTYTVTISFDMPWTFEQDEVEQAEEGDESDLDPTAAALEKLAAEVQEYLGQQFGVSNVEAWTDFDHLLGVDGED